VVDPDAVYGEYDEDDNVKWFKIKIGPDLHVSAISTAATAVAGSTHSVQDTTRNRGVSGAPASVMTFYLATTSLGANAIPVGSRPVPPLAAGASDTATTTVNIPVSVGSARTLPVRVRRRQQHSDRAQRGEQRPLRRGQDRPRPARERPHRPSSAARGATIVVTATVRNRGVSPAAASTARFYLSTRKTYDATAIPLGRRAVPTLAAGAQSQAATSLTLTASAGGRTYYVLVIADGDGVIAEPLETNSLSYLTVVIP
jgi:subtilase family serine protease